MFVENINGASHNFGWLYFYHDKDFPILDNEWSLMGF